MRRKITLYIAGLPVDLDEQSFILFNYTTDDLSNPTTIRNSFSQQITLKGTPNNNKIFGSIFRSDRKTIIGDEYVGAYYDATRKTSFTIYNEMSEIVESGYIKLDNISKKGSLIEYQITLYGGLGSFFYGLMYNAEGEKRSLMEMTYKDVLGNPVKSFSIEPTAAAVKEAWQYLETPSNTSLYYPFWNVLNFAPCYNGIPDKFDAKTALFGNNIYINMTPSASVDGVNYGKKSGFNTWIVKFTNSHTEWEIRDLRWYLQRPIVSIKSIISAICDKANNGGYEVTLDDTFFNEGNLSYSQAWITLPMIASEDWKSTDCLNNLMKTSTSPAEILISYAKVFGLMFLYDSGMKRISILTRNTFYENHIIDITKRLDNSSIRITPIVADSMYYQFGDKVIGQFAEEYKKEFQREYGIQKVNTGYDFENGINILTKDLSLQDAVEVIESNRLFTSDRYISVESVAFVLKEFILPAYEDVKQQLWAVKDGEEESKDISVSSQSNKFYYDNTEVEYGDWLPKVQLHKNNKAEDGANVLLLFNGIKPTPIYSEKYKNLQKDYWLTNDHADMFSLNNDIPCWNLTGYDYQIKSLPSFRRNHIGSNGKTIDNSFEWGLPLARAVHNLEGDATIYSKWWKDYLGDLYDNDTKRMTCKVNLKGLMVNQSLLRNFFWYENAIWRLNKITNHSLTTYDDTECEFVKVKDIKNYTQGQKL